MKILLIVILSLLGCLLIAVGVAVVLTLRRPKQTATYSPAPDGRGEEYARKLSRMIQMNTVSEADTDQREKFLAFHQVLEELFPLVHQQLEKTEIDGNLLYCWKGRKSEKPLVLMSHQDVSPAGGGWLYDPFSGYIENGKVWGRGASDSKCSLMAFFQAVEEMLEEGIVPENDVYLSSSCTEEWAGDGCEKLVDELEKRGVRPFLVCDEGGSILTEPIGGIKGYFAMIGVCEKGKADIKLTATSEGGHSSAPERHSPIARLSDFIHTFEHGHVFRRRMSPEVLTMFERLAPYGNFRMRLILGNLWLFKLPLLWLMPLFSAQGAAMLQTTIAFTMQSGSDACNVMPQEATLGANLRFIPHEGLKESMDKVQRLAKKHKLTLEVLREQDVSRVTDSKGEGYRLVERVIQGNFPGIVTSPYIMTGATDSRNYERICDNVVRFAPVVYGPEQMKGIHGMNENIGIDCLSGAVDFYKSLIQMNGVLPEETTVTVDPVAVDPVPAEGAEPAAPVVEQA